MNRIKMEKRKGLVAKNTGDLVMHLLNQFVGVIGISESKTLKSARKECLLSHKMNLSRLNQLPQSFGKIASTDYILSRTKKIYGIWIHPSF